MPHLVPEMLDQGPSKLCVGPPCSVSQHHRPVLNPRVLTRPQSDSRSPTRVPRTCAAFAFSCLGHLVRQAIREEVGDGLRRPRVGHVLGVIIILVIVACGLHGMAGIKLHTSHKSDVGRGTPGLRQTAQAPALSQLNSARTALLNLGSRLRDRSRNALRIWSSTPFVTPSTASTGSTDVPVICSSCFSLEVSSSDATDSGPKAELQGSALSLDDLMHLRQGSQAFSQANKEQVEIARLRPGLGPGHQVPPHLPQPTELPQAEAWEISAQAPHMFLESPSPR